MHVMGIAILPLLGIEPATASDTGLGAISYAQIYTGVFMVSVSGSRSSQPACATIPGRWAVDASAPGNQAMIAGLLTTRAQGKRVVVHGTGTCSVWADTETILYVDFPE